MKGEVRNPLGANGGADYFRIRRLGNAELVEVGTLILDNNIAALREIVDDAKGPDGKGNPKCKHSVLKVWMSTIALRGIQKGDPYALDSLLNRIVGKVPQDFTQMFPPEAAPEPTKLETNPIEVDERRARIAKYQSMLAQIEPPIDPSPPEPAGEAITPEVLPADGE